MSNEDREPRDERPHADEVEGAEEYDADATLAEADDSESGAGAADRRVAVRQKAKRVSTKQRVRKVVLRVVLVLIVIAALVAAGLWIRQTVVTEVTKPAAEPSNAPDGAFVFDDEDLSSMLDDGPDAEETQAPEDENSDGDESDGNGDGEEPERVRVDVYVDYLSPESGLFHSSNAAQLAKWVEEDAISLTYHPVALLTAKSNGTRYSERAMAAAGCVAGHESPHIVAYNNALLMEQPEVDTPGYTSEELSELATELGVENEDINTCIETDEYADWARETTSELSEGGLPGQSGQELTGAPTILVNDQPYTGALDDPGELSQFVLTVESSEFYTSPSPDSTD